MARGNYIKEVLLARSYNFEWYEEGMARGPEKHNIEVYR